jgi:hypothetical protein
MSFDSATAYSSVWSRPGTITGRKKRMAVASASNPLSLELFHAVR